MEIAYASKIPLKAISRSLKGTDEDSNVQDALRVLDIVLRQQAANRYIFGSIPVRIYYHLFLFLRPVGSWMDRGCLLVRQSFFHDDSRNFTNVGGGALGVKGFHSSFRPTQGGLSLNMGIDAFFPKFPSVRLLFYLLPNLLSFMKMCRQQ